MNPKRKKRLFISVLFVGIVLGPLILLILTSQNSHRFNWGYQTWKLGWSDFEPEYLQFLTQDALLREELVGKSLSEIEKLFPDLHGPERATDYQSYYSSYIDHPNYRWIGDSAWTIELEDGHVKALHIWKG
ncbi:MAG: hypothetical protein ACSHYF_15005 [Verrucomicrobiaceae bacterium]